jgi:hypothetical protein
LQRGTEREAPEGTSGFTFLVTSFLNEKEVTPKTETDQREPAARSMIVRRSSC